MDTPVFLDRFQVLISKNKIEESFRLLETYTHFSKTLHRDLINIKSKFSGLEDSIKKGEINIEDYWIRQNKCRDFLLVLAEKVEEEYKSYQSSGSTYTVKQNISGKLDIRYISEFFNSEEDYLGQVRRCLDEKNICAIYGEAGTGKTYLAEKLVSDYISSKKTELVWWIETDDIDECMKALAKALHIDPILPDQVHQAIMEKLSTIKSWLLVFDDTLSESRNSDRQMSISIFEEKYLKALQEMNKNKDQKILITSRNWQLSDSIESITLKKWSVKDVRKYFSGKGDAQYMSYTDYGLPISVVLTEKYQSRVKSTSDPEIKNIRQVLTLIHSYLKDKHYPTFRFLNAASFMGSTIPLDKMVFKLKETNREIEGFSLHTLVETTEMLASFRLLSHLQDRLYQIHALVSDVLREILKNYDPVQITYGQSLSEAYNVLEWCFDYPEKKDSDSNEYYQQMIKVAETILEFIDNYYKDNRIEIAKERVFITRYRCGLYFFDKGRGISAEKSLSRAAECAGDNSDLLYFHLSRRRLAMIYDLEYIQHQLIQDYLNGGMEYFMATNNHEEWIITQEIYNKVIEKRKQYDLIIENNKKLLERVGELNLHHRIPLIYHDLGRVYWYKREFELSEKFLARSLEEAESKGQKGSGLYYTQLILGTVCGQLEKYTEQERIHTQVFMFLNEQKELRRLSYTAYYLTVFAWDRGEYTSGYESEILRHQEELTNDSKYETITFNYHLRKAIMDNNMERAEVYYNQLNRKLELEKIKNAADFYDDGCLTENSLIEYADFILNTNPDEQETREKATKIIRIAQLITGNHPGNRADDLKRLCNELQLDT